MWPSKAFRSFDEGIDSRPDDIYMMNQKAKGKECKTGGLHDATVSLAVTVARKGSVRDLVEPVRGFHV